MSSLIQCADRYCDDCTVRCQRRTLECGCGELLQLKVSGRLVRIGSVDGEHFTFPCDPQSTVDDVKHSAVDLFTFLRKPGEDASDLDYPYEMDNLAILPVSTFDHWWKEQIDAKTRNLVRKSEKRGIIVEEAPFCDELLRAIVEIYNETPIRQGGGFCTMVWPLKPQEPMRARSFRVASSSPQS